ncbi:MAG: hypothetical protein CMN30_18810 [Sandaracinus sp.]|nr:hypothetical protein [Sandaracinus sp.]
MLSATIPEISVAEVFPRTDVGGCGVRRRCVIVAAMDGQAEEGESEEVANEHVRSHGRRKWSQ